MKTIEEYRQSVRRLINSHFRREPGARISIPARPDYDDDIIVCWAIDEIESLRKLIGDRNINITGVMNRVPLKERSYLKTEAVMALLGYTDKGGFLAAARAAGIPFLRINSRNFKWEESAVQAWIDRKTIGGVK